MLSLQYVPRVPVLFVSVFVQLSVREHISETARSIFANFLCMLPMVVVRFSSDSVAILLCYVLPV